MWNARPLTPGRTRGREQQRAADAVAASRSPTKSGEHSVWCDLVVVERGCFPLLARGVVVVLTEEKVFLRVASTAFTFTVHLQDVVQVRHVVPKEVVELHVRLLTAPPEAARRSDESRAPHAPSSSSSSAFTHRLYRLALTEHHTELCAQLFHTLVDLLPSPAQQRTAEETFTDDAVVDYLVQQPCSMLPLDLLDRAGLQEVEWVEGTPSTSADASAARASSGFSSAPPFTPSSLYDTTSTPITAHVYNEVSESDAAPVMRRSHSRGSASVNNSTTGHLRTIYVAPAPSFWRLPKHAAPAPQQDLRLTWSSARGQTSLPQAEMRAAPAAPRTSELYKRQQPPSPPSASGGPASLSRLATDHKRSSVPPSRRETVDMSNRESSLMTDMCGLRPLAAPASAPSSRTSQSSDRTLKVQYGPVVSG